MNQHMVLPVNISRMKHHKSFRKKHYSEKCRHKCLLLLPAFKWICIVVTSDLSLSHTSLFPSLPMAYQEGYPVQAHFYPPEQHEWASLGLSHYRAFFMYEQIFYDLILFRRHKIYQSRQWKRSMLPFFYFAP